MLDESKYPMNYKEFEEKVVSLYLDSLNDEQLEMFVPLLVFYNLTLAPFCRVVKQSSQPRTKIHISKSK